MNQLPTEIIQRIFSFIHPSESLRFSRLSTRIYSCLACKDFAVENLMVHVNARSISLASTPKALGVLWFVWPSYFQEVYAETCLKGMLGIIWIDNMALLGTLIPPSMGRLIHLYTLRLSDCGLRGTIPPELGHLTNLHILHLQNNSLEGEIPSTLASGCIHLKDLRLAKNCLTAGFHVPFTLQDLKILDLAYNPFETATIPATQIGQLKKLEFLSLTSTRLSGSLPREMGNLNKLQELLLSNNNVSGVIPVEMQNLTNLVYVEFRKNPGISEDSFEPGFTMREPILRGIKPVVLLGIEQSVLEEEDDADNLYWAD
ncbi:hypothetical protein BJ741DRAFT_660798 [Chytriomyces cf. hyalinus JEL632]|nr:hypothetical protein BJ741DRAFT_660798 [Chytriomyces cf. hyalinus JEL632]